MWDAPYLAAAINTEESTKKFTTETELAPRQARPGTSEAAVRTNPTLLQALPIYSACFLVCLELLTIECTVCLALECESTLPLSLTSVVQAYVAVCEEEILTLERPERRLSPNGAGSQHPTPLGGHSNKRTPHGFGLTRDADTENGFPLGWSHARAYPTPL